MSGWIKLHRDIQKHWVFRDEKFFKWWAIILFNINHNDRKISLGYDFYVIKRGECAKSIRGWATEFGCSTKATQNFVKMLENDQMITRKIIGKGKQRLTLINVINYDKYQGTLETQENTQEHTQENTQGKRKGNAKDHTYKEYKKNKELKEEKKEPPTPLNFPFDTEKFISAWNNYKAYRKKRDKFSFFNIDSENRKLTELKNLAKDNEEIAIKILNQTIDNNWSGIYQLKSNGEKEQGNTTSTKSNYNVPIG